MRIVIKKKKNGFIIIWRYDYYDYIGQKKQYYRVSFILYDQRVDGWIKSVAPGKFASGKPNKTCR